MTCGAFSGLVIDDEGTRRVLKGERAGGERLAVEGMSDGTRDQLFLALRLAYVENHCEGAAACPVILDDVLMAFDDARAGATLQALAELGKKTQVIVFTHHAHHVGLAEAALAPGDFRVHQLQGGVATIQAA